MATSAGLPGDARITALIAPSGDPNHPVAAVAGRVERVVARDERAYDRGVVVEDAGERVELVVHLLQLLERAELR